MKKITFLFKKVFVLLCFLFTVSAFSQDFNVQHLQDDVANTGGTNTSFTAVASINNAVALANNNRKSNAGINGSSANLDGDDLAGARTLTGTGTLTYYRESGSLGSNARFNTSIWEYIGPAAGNNEMIVRGRYAVTLNGTTNSTTQALTGITNAADCIPFITGIMNNTTNDDADSGTAIAYLQNATTLSVLKGSNGNNVTVYITLVEFTGSNWTVLHGDSGNSASDTGTLTLRNGSDGTGTATNVSAWSDAVIFSHHIGDTGASGANDAISDNWPVMDPGSNNQTVDWTFDAQHDSAGTNRQFVHVLTNTGLNVTRYQNTTNAANETTVDITSAGLTSTNEALIIGSSRSSGGGTAYGRGWRNYYFNSTTQAAHWSHRSGNTMAHEIQIVDLSGLSTGHEMNLQGNAVTIADGDTTPTTVDDTDFGNVDITVGTNPNIFTIQNTGTGPLNLTAASPYVVISGAHAGDFTLTAIPATPIAASGSTTFTITFNPSALGLRTATISIANDDADENPYNFDIQGTGTTSYCTSNGNGTDGYYTGTRQVIFNTINNSTPIEDNAYSDFTGISTTVTQTSSYNLTVNVNTDGNYTSHTFAWIDWNQDYDFNDAGESFDLGTATNVSNGATTASPYSITIPGTSTLGNTRMRISTKYNADPTNCETGFDGEVEDYTINIISSTPQPEINIVGNGTSITSGDNTPSVTDDTDFGNVDVTVGTNPNTFTIQNTGAGPLNLTAASPYVVISGAHAGDFILTAIPATPIAPSGSTTFTITFNPSAIGLRTASVSIANDDTTGGENPYNFNIQGNGTTTVQEINVTGLGNDILTGDITPTTTDDTDFGSVLTASGTSVSSFTIENLGTVSNLLLTGASPYVAISGTHAADFTVTTIPSNSIAASSNTSFIITFDPNADGLRQATVTIANNDGNGDELSYTFNIQGTGFTPPPCGSSVLHTADFETGLDGWTDGGTDAQRISYASRSYSNTYSLEIRNLDASGSNSSVISPLIDFSSYDKVDFKFFFTSYSGENGDNFIVEYSNNSGSTWTVINDFICNDVSAKDADYESGTAIIFYARTSTMFKTVHTFPVGTVSQIRVRADGSDTSDLIYIDNVTITGTQNCSPTTAPGGVTSNLDLWLRADKVDGTTVGTDGANVSKWTDTGKGNHAETVVDGQEPVYRNNTSKNINFNPVIEFENNHNTAIADMTYINTRDELMGTSGFNSNDMFLVVIPDPTITTAMYPLDTFTSSDPLSTTSAEDVTGVGFGGYTQRLTGEYFTYCIGTSSGAGPYVGYGSGDLTGTNNYNQFNIINVRHNSTNSNMEIYLNANPVTTTVNDLPSYATVNNRKYWLGRSQYWNGSFDGRIAEIITFDSRLTDGVTERSRIESYLALKYGITLGVNGVSQNYIDSSGNIVWDAVNSVGYCYDIAGIFRDEASDHSQKQSKSINSSSVVTLALKDIYTTNSANPNSFDTDLDYLVWGHNNAALSGSNVININLGASSTSVTTLFDRRWKIYESRPTGSNDILDVKVSIPGAVLPALSDPTTEEYTMIVSSDAAFGVNHIVDVIPLTANGSDYETWYDFDYTRFFTFGIASKVSGKYDVEFGVGDFLVGEDSVDLNSSYSVSSWVRNTGSGGTIVSKGTAYDFKIDGSGKVQADLNGTTQLTSATSVNDSKWHHVAFTYTGSTLRLYIDGVEDGNSPSTPVPVPTSTNHRFAIGINYTDKNNFTTAFSGSIDEVRIWDSALSQMEIQYIMNQEIIEHTDNTVDGSVLPHNITRNEVNSIPWGDLQAYHNINAFYGTTVEDGSNNDNWVRIKYLVRGKAIIDNQTSPLPYGSNGPGNWSTNTTWKNGTELYIPGSASIVDPNVTVDWNIASISHNVTMDNSSLPAANNKNRTLLGLFADSTNELTISSDNATTVTHYLELNGSIDLEGESQLIQTDKSVLQVGANGSLERDQQGSSDLYTYNYWSSPVGAVNSTATNDTYTHRFTLPDVLSDGTIPASPGAITYITNSVNGSASPFGIADYWIWKFANQLDDDYSSWQHMRSTGCR